MKCEQVTQFLDGIPEAGDWLGNQAESEKGEELMSEGFSK